MSVQTAVGDFLFNLLHQIVPKSADFGCPVFHILKSIFYGSPQTHNSGNIFRSCPSSPLLGSSVKERADFDSLPDIKKADSLGSSQLMAAGTEQINALLSDINGDMAVGLNGIRVEQNSFLSGNPSDFPDGLKGSDFIVGKHDGNQNRIRPDGLFQLFQLQDSIFIYIYIGKLKASLFQIAAGMKHGMMLNCGSDDVSAPICISLSRGDQRPVVRLRASCRKIDFPGLRV